MDASVMDRQRKGEQHFILDEVARENPMDGVKLAHFLLGEPEDPKASHVFWIRQPPGLIFEPHSHPSDYCEILLEGTQRVGKKWHSAGEIRVVKAGTGYGPLESGPEGCTVLVIFQDDYTLIPKGGSGAKSPHATDFYDPEELKDLYRPVNL